MYFVCTREENDCKELYGGAWGYYWNREDAVRAVHRNVTDMHETIYPYAIIERLEPGLFPVPKEREWFGWDEEKDGFYEIETPECNKYFPHNFSVALGTVGDENSKFIEQLPATVDENTPCYFIMAMNSNDREGESVRRCGFFIDRETAFKAVRENWGDIHNGKYDVAWIECIHPYILAWSTECVWFRWDDEKNGYYESKAPEEFADWPEPPYYPVSFI